MKFYRENCRALKWWLKSFIIQIFIYPILILIFFYLILFFSEKYDRGVNFNFSNNFIEILTYISWFLFAGLSILLSNTALDKSQMDNIWNKYKSFVCKFWWVDNERCENQEKINLWVKQRIKKFKFSLLLDILFVVVISVVSILLSILEFSIIWLLSKYLFVVCIIQLSTLIPRIISYLKIVEFNIK